MVTAAGGGYTLVARLFHWVLALLIIGMLALGFYASGLENSPLKIRLFFWHKSFGISILALVLLRLLWRLRHRPPAMPERMPKLERNGAKTAHWLLYSLMLLMPVSGWLIHSASGYSFKVFGWFNLPALVSPEKALQQQMAELHEIAAYLLIALLVLHLLAALKHRFIDRDEVFAGMALRRPYFIALALVGLVLLALVWRSLPVAAPTETTAQASSAEADLAQPPANSEQSNLASAPAWFTLIEASELGFTGSYDEVPFNGVFHRFTPMIRFAPTQLAQSEFDVRIDVTSVDTQSRDRDDALAGSEWFGFKRFSEARFTAKRFEQLGPQQFVAQGILRIRNIERPLALPFTWQTKSRQTSTEQAKLSFAITINRLDYDIGTGLWAGETVGHEVIVRADLQLEAVKP